MAERSRKPTTKAQPPARRGKPQGLASALERKVQTEDGEATVHEVLVAELRKGCEVTVAAARARVSRSAVYDWLHEGARLSSRLEAGEVTPAALSPTQQAALRFAMDALYAVASAESEAVGNITALGRGITRRRTTTTTVGDGATVTEVAEEVGPLLAANVVLLERRFPERWTRRQQIEVTAGEDPEAAPESPLPALVAALEAMEARRRETDRLIADG